MLGTRERTARRLLQHLAARVDHARLRAPQHQLADGVGEARAGLREALGLQPLRRGGIGGEQHLEGRAVADLGVELAGGAERDHGVVAGGGLEALGDPRDGRRHVGRDRHAHLGGRRGEAREEQEGGQQQAGHGSLFQK